MPTAGQDRPSACVALPRRCVLFCAHGIFVPAMNQRSHVLPATAPVCMGLTATDAAPSGGLSARSVSAVCQRMRARLAQAYAALPPFSRVCSKPMCPASGLKRIRSKRGRGAGGKPSSWAWLRGDCVHTETAPNASKATLPAIVRGKVDPNGFIHADGWPGLHGLVDLGLERDFRTDHGNDGFVKGYRHVNGIASFWSYPNIGRHGFMALGRTSLRCISRRPSPASTIDTLTSMRHGFNCSETIFYEAFAS